MKIAISELEHLREEIKNCHQIIKDFQMKRQWVGLTEEDWDKVGDMPDTFDQGAAWAAARLQERNNG
jgi:hypothetical protein